LHACNNSEVRGFACTFFDPVGKGKIQYPVTLPVFNPYNWNNCAGNIHLQLALAGSSRKRRYPMRQ
jgi:hypothetical protein